MGRILLPPFDQVRDAEDGVTNHRSSGHRPSLAWTVPGSHAFAAKASRVTSPSAALREDTWRYR